METDPLRSSQWSQLSSESNKNVNSPPKITSSLWKQLSEEQDLSEIHFPVFTDSFTEDNVSSSDYDVNSNVLPFSKSEMWKAPTSDLDTDVGQYVGLRNPWDSITSTSDRSGNLSYLRSGLPNSARNSGATTEDIYGKSNRENIFPSYTKAVGNTSSYNALLDKSDPISLTKDLLPPHQSLSSNVWATNLKAPFGSSNQDTLTGNDSYELSGNLISWEQVPSSLRPALRDIGNLSNSLPTGSHKMDNLHLIQRSNEFSSHQSSLPFNIPPHDLYCNQQATTSSFQPQKQHTDLIALMQELSVLTNARDMGNLSYNSSAVSACTSQKPPSTNPVFLSNKGCVFCKNNNYHSTFYKSHVLKDERGHCQCPVLRMYVCPLCNATGDSAHTLKYCPRNTVTRGDPISAGLPPGKVTNWREVANRMMGRYSSNN